MCYLFGGPFTSQGQDIARLHCSTFITKIACPVAEEESLVYRLPIPYANLPSEQTIKPTQMCPAATCYEQGLLFRLTDHDLQWPCASNVLNVLFVNLKTETTLNKCQSCSRTDVI